MAKCRKAYDREYAKRNREKRRLSCSKYYYRNKDKVIKAQIEYQKKRSKEDPIYAMRLKVRNALKNLLVYGRNSRILPFTRQELVQHLESCFLEGMSWDNRELWHVDHIIPLSTGNSVEEVIELARLNNLQCLWASDNIRKSNKEE